MKIGTNHLPNMHCVYKQSNQILHNENYREVGQKTRESWIMLQDAMFQTHFILTSCQYNLSP